jgi:hypothetical protein
MLLDDDCERARASSADFDWSRDANVSRSLLVCGAAAARRVDG